MKEVSCRVSAHLIDALEDARISPEEIAGDLPIPLSELRDPASRMSWDLLCELLERIAERAGGPAVLTRLGSFHTQSPAFEFLGKVARPFLSVRDVYWMGVHFFGPSMFPMVSAELRHAADGSLRETVRISPAYRDCPEFFHMMEGALQVGPRHLGLSDARVTAEIFERSAEFSIQLPAELSFLSRFRRRARVFMAPGDVISGFDLQVQELKDRYEEVCGDHARIRARTGALERVNQVGRQLAEQTDFRSLPSLLLSLLESSLGYEGITLWVEPIDGGEAITLGGVGLRQGEPRRFPLRTARGRVGQLEVFGASVLDGERNESEGVPLLSDLLPWIALALENARSYQRMREQTQHLEDKVKERTESLANVNLRLRAEVQERERDGLALKESHERLMASERLAAVGTLAAGIAHEINNPIGSILALAQDTLGRLEDLPERDESGEAEEREHLHRSLKTVERESRRCGRIVKSVLQFSRGEATEKWPCNLNDTIGRAAAQTHHYAEERLASLELDLAVDGLFVEMNPIEIEQVAVNLIRNAIEANRSSGTITVSTARVGELASFSVRDRGGGMDEAEQSQVFDPFFTTRQEEGGTGLGLSMVHGIVRSHDGEIDIQSQRGEGTLVTVTFHLLEVDRASE